VYSQIADVSYKRLTREIAVPAGGANMSFWTSYDTELHWDHVFVEAHTVGQDNWTTLPDLNGNTSQDTGDSCPAGWRVLHPWLDHYQRLNADGTCSPAGTTGAWNASSGNSAGWQQWNVDLSAFAGQQVEVSISYVSDWAVQGVGVFVDDIEVSTGAGTTSFEAGLDGWVIAEAPPGSASNSNTFIRTDASGFPVGNAIATPHSLLLGFGLEGVSTAAERTAVMGRVLEHLLD
jgi:bacillopeptidase F (M6 metalloprotease family)